MGFEKETKMNWTDEDPSKGIEVFDWLVSHGMTNVAATMFTECLCTVRQFEEYDIWYSGEDEELHQKWLNALNNVGHFFAGGDESRLLPLLQRIKCMDNEIPDDSGAEVERIAFRALRIWRASFPPDSELPPVTSGEWLVLLDVGLEVLGPDGQEPGEDDKDYVDSVAQERLGSLFQEWRNLPSEEQEASFSDWLQVLHPPRIDDEKSE